MSPRLFSNLALKYAPKSHQMRLIPMRYAYQRLFHTSKYLRNEFGSSSSSSTSLIKLPKIALTVGTFAALIYVSLPAEDFYPAFGNSGNYAYHPLTKQPAINHMIASKREDTDAATAVKEKEETKFPDIVANENASPSQPADIPLLSASDTDISPSPAIVAPVQEASNKPELIKAHYVLVGGGTASYSALKAIKERSPDADVLIITNEEYAPYMRPPLSKELWFTENPSSLLFKDWGGTERSLIFDPLEKYCIEGEDNPEKKPRLLLNRAVVSMDVEAQTLTLDDNRIIKYTKVLLATGGSPKLLPVFQNVKDTGKISTFRTVDDMKLVETVLKSGNKKIVIVGGGFLGSELACASARFGKKFGSSVVQVFPEQGNMGLVFPKYLSNWTLNKVKNEGVEVVNGTTVEKASLGQDGRLELTLTNGKSIEVDHVIVAAGIEPNVKIAENSGLEIDEIRGGIVVNAELEARKNVFVAGDLTSYHDVTLGRRRVEHHDHAVLSGRWAGKNMTGSQKPYKHQSMFWSDLGPEIGYEAVGILDSSMPTIGIWSKATENDTPKAAVESSKDDIRSGQIEKISESNETKDENHSETKKASSESHKLSKPTADHAEENYGKGVVFYLKNDKIVGVLLWNMFHKTSLAQKLIQEQRRVDDIKQMAKLFNIHED